MRKTPQSGRVQAVRFLVQIGFCTKLRQALGSVGGVEKLSNFPVVPVS